MGVCVTLNFLKQLYIVGTEQQQKIIIIIIETIAIYYCSVNSTTKTHLDLWSPDMGPSKHFKC